MIAPRFLRSFCLFFVVLCSSATVSAVEVSPGGMSGWVINDSGPFTAPFEFDDGPGTPPLGNGSVQVGPIDMAAASKFIMYPPIANLDAADLESFSFDFYLNSVPDLSPSQFYVNVYVDLANDGLGNFDASFYDCRYDLTADSGLPKDTWNTVMFDQNSGWTVVTDTTTEGNLCPTTLAGLPANAQIIFIALNAGDTSATDVGLEGAFDRVVTQIDGQITQYDFEKDTTTCYVSRAGESNVVFCL